MARDLPMFSTAVGRPRSPAGAAVDRDGRRPGRASGGRRVHRAPPPPGLDPGADAVGRELPRPQGPAPRPGPQHGLRGGPLPEHRGVLGPAHRHDHDPRRHVHPGVRVLRRQDRPPDLVRRRRAAPRRGGGRRSSASSTSSSPASPATTCPTAARGSSPRRSRAMRATSPGMGIEVLIPDFDGSDDRLRTVMDARPDILNHNLETVKRLQKPVRKRARWDRSLYVLRRAKEMAGEIGYPVHTKSSLMVGLGETRDELHEAFEALRAADVDILTIGQYLRPTLQHLPLERYYHPDEFAEMKTEALALGFKHVESAPLVRSSYHARDQVPGAELKRAPPPGDHRCRGPDRPTRGLTGPAGERRLRPGPARTATPADRSGRPRGHRGRGGDLRRDDQAVGPACPQRPRRRRLPSRWSCREPVRLRSPRHRPPRSCCHRRARPAGRTSPRPSRPTTPGASARSPSINGSTGSRPARPITSYGAPRPHRPAWRPRRSAGPPTRCRCSGSPVRAPRSRETSGSGGSTSRTRSNGSMRPRSAPSPRRPRCCSSGRERTAER